MSPIREYSAGVIPFLCDLSSAHRYYLLVHSARVHNPRARWEFPKGAIESGETPCEAAAREFAEETGLRRWQFRDGFMRSLTYTYARSGARRIKTVVYFIGQVFDPSAIRRTVEHVEDASGIWYRWSRIEEADRLLAHEGMRTLLHAADSWLGSTPRVRSGRSSRPRHARSGGMTCDEPELAQTRLQGLARR